MSEKAVLRTKLLAARRALPPRALVAANERVLAALLERIAEYPLVTAYVPVGTEPGGALLPQALTDAGHRVLLPILRTDLDLDWAAFDGTLMAGPRGLRQPAGPQLGADAVRTANLAIVPALAVDRRGTRLGRGGGSYDRALARVAAEMPVVALLHDGELLDELPAERHDRPVNAVVTPSGGWYDLRAGRSGPDAAHLALETRECQDGGI